MRKSVLSLLLTAVLAVGASTALATSSFSPITALAASSPSASNACQSTGYSHACGNCAKVPDSVGPNRFDPLCPLESFPVSIGVQVSPRSRQSSIPFRAWLDVPGCVQDALA